ncbi:MAG: UDP-N-acetylpyruvoylglucosamine reductase [Candidatus Saccharibacteria bacterium]|nr:UDP-N-acetylpyruvoylglucosamine reductase [Candidatus Saccharibacteria bacterium]
MNIREDVSLATHSTMRLGGKARYLAEAGSDTELQEIVNWAKERQLKFIIIGQGSNIVWRDEGFDGLVIVNNIPGKEIVAEDETSATVILGGGENWDEAVAWAVSKDLSGIEFLSLIPGTVGAAPVQNIGAYGAELADTLKEVGVYDTQNDCFESILNESCKFSYRSSRFKSSDKGRYMITHVVLRLNKSRPAPPFYDALQAYLDEHGVTDFTPANIREAVIAIRSSKLPDWRTVANNGSFFTNPIISQSRFDELKSQHPDIKGWPAGKGKVKIAAGWLVENAGFKGVHDEDTGMATWEKQALVLVNEHARSTADLLAFRQKIIFKVDELFGVVLEQEPELLP